MMGGFTRPQVQPTVPTSPVEATHVTPLHARNGATRAIPEERKHSSLALTDSRERPMTWVATMQ